MAKVYTNSMASRSGFIEVVDDNGEIVLKYQALLPAFKRVDYGDNREHIVAPGDTWQNIALRYLGTAELWWVIAEFNRVLDPFTELESGKRLVIPSANRVRLNALSELV